MKRLLTCFSVLLLFLACSKDSEDPSPAPTPKPKFTITIAAGDGGSVSSSGGSYEQGSTVSVTATAASGYRFVGWSNGETSATLNIVVTGNISITANFERIAYSVEVSGSITKGSFLTGSTLTFYELNNALSQTGKSYNTDITDDFGSFNLSVEELTEDYSRVVGEGFYWNEVTNETTEEKLSLNAISEIKEDINVNILTHLEYQRVVELVKNQGKTFAEAKAQALTETLSSLGIETTSNYGTSENYNFKNGDEASKILLVASVIIQAERTTAEVTSLITAVANDLKDNGNIDNTEIKTEIALPLAKIDLEQVASNVYERYKEQNPELTESNYLSDYLETAKAEYQEFLPDADGDGVQDDLDLCPDTPEGEEADANGCGKTQKQYQLTTTVEGSGSISEEVIEQPTASYDYGTTVRLTANPISGWEFKEWKGDITSTENPIEVTVVEEVAVTAVFVKKKFTVTTTTEGEGTVSIAPEEESYEFQSNIELTATPSEGWVFSKWSGDIDSTENPVSLTVNDNKEVTAVFKRKQYELTVSVEGEGAVAEEIVTQPTQYDNGTVVKLTASGSEGWAFVNWSGDIESSENPTTITVDKEKAVTATFEKADSDGDGVVDLEDLCPDTPEGATVNANGCHDFIYVAENGVTIKARETAIVGDTQELDGETYKVVDEAMLREMATKDEDVTKVVTTRVTDLSKLFDMNNSFNQDIGSWDTSNVTTLKMTFAYANEFNQDLNYWDTSSVINMEGTFYDARDFRGSIGNWDVSKVTNMSSMFATASRFNEDIINWDVSSVTDMSHMFQGAEEFNQAIGIWDTSNVSSMTNMFQNTSFNQPIDNWDVSSVTNMHRMFQGSEFNQPIGNWNMSNVTDIGRMFNGNQYFDQDISGWNVSNVIDMEETFRNSSFNQSIEEWDVSKVVNMKKMFDGASSFNQDLSSWCVSKITEKPDGFNQASGLADENLPIWGQCGQIELAANGVTIVANDNAVVGESYKLTNDGDSYKVVDESMLREMVTNDEDVTKVVTTRVTDMNLLFFEKTSFNEDISSWDISNVTNMRSMFSGAMLFDQDISLWEVDKVSTMHGMFGSAEKFNQDISSWNVENVTDFERMFSSAKAFNQNISSWDISKATSLNYMFGSAESFNQDLSQWDVSNIKSMAYTFADATAFNGNISSWNVSNVETMSHMFGAAKSFNQDISSWDTSSVITTERMFADADAFNIDISSWDVSSVTNMDHMFYEANEFNQDLANWCVNEITEKPDGFNQASGLSDENLPIWGQCGEIELAANGVTIVANDNAVVGESYKLTNDGDSYKVVDESMLREMVANDEDVTKVVTTKIANFENLFQNKTNFDANISSWDLSNVTNLKGTFRGATNFNQDISNWNTSKVVIMSSMFNDATNFDQDISKWNTSKVLYMDYMFKGAISFDQDISSWNVGNVTSMYQMFSSGSTFNQPIGNWDVSNVTNMGEMFGNNTAFNQNLNSWDVSNVRNMAWMFNSTIFNTPIGNWDVSNVTDMNHMFRFNSKFNQDIGSWDVSSVLNFSNAFVGARAFNQDISSWNVSSATNMDGMFWEAVQLNQDLSSWCVSGIEEEPNRFAESTLMNTSQIPVWGQCGEIELAANGVTIVANDNAVVGESYRLTNDGDSYKVVDETMLREMVANDEDVTLAVTTRVTDLSLLFNLNETFNQDIGSWDTSNNTSLFATFAYTQQFNQDLTYWDTSSVSNMESTFIGAAAFNGDISNWDVSNVTNLSFTFDSATSFNGDISNWNVSNVSTMRALFANSNFNQSISNWNVSSVTTMESMFNNAGSFNQNLNNWDVSGVTTMLAMFANASAFNGTVGSWDVSSVTNMESMFNGAEDFNQDLNDWNVSSVTNMWAMFANASTFNGIINSWDVSSVTNMESMFSGALLFNRALNNWDVSSVDRMKYMFYNSDSFNQNLSAWCVPQFDQQPDGFNFSGIISNENLPVWGTCPDGSEGLIAYYPFNGNASDATGNGNDGTVVGATLTTDRHGNENSAYYFGDNCVDRVDANIDTSAIDASQAFTFSIWYYHISNGCNSPRLFEFWPGNEGPSKFVAGGVIDSQQFIYLGTGANMGGNWVNKPQEWTHLVYSVDINTYEVYQDGVLIASGETTLDSISLAQDVAFGRMNHAAWDGIEGKLDDIRLYDTKLTPSQVQQLFEETASSNHNSGGSGGSGAGSTGS